MFSHLKDPKALLKWFFTNWLTLSEFVLLAILAMVLWACCYPDIDKAIEFKVSWILQNFVVNFLLVLCVAGGLHWYYNRAFLFSDQVKDNMFWALTSGVVHLTFFQSISMWLMANGYVPAISINANPVWFALGFVLLPIWSAFHFYWIHRFLHVPFMYKHFHSLHHKNINIGPWSGISMHPVEHFLYMSSMCIHWVVASHPVH